MKMKKNSIIKLIITIICTMLFIALVIFANSDNPDNNGPSGKASIQFAKAEVKDIISEKTEEDDRNEQLLIGTQEIKVMITSGKHKGEHSTITNHISALSNVPVEVGDKIIIRVNTNSNGSYSFSVYNYDRTMLIMVLAVLFFGLLSFIGGKKGIKAMIGLIFTLFCVIFLLIPLLLKGYSPIPTAILIIVITTLACMSILDGVNEKTISASIGTILGVAIAGLFAYISGEIAHINGYNTNEAESLMLIASNTNFKVKGILTAGILISSLGAVMDVAMSISSSIYELHTVNSNMSRKELFNSGMNIGRDAMGTMANTLILAFTGSSLNLLVMIFSYGIPFMQLINTDIIGIEIIQSLAGSIGIILTVPIVAIISSTILKKK